MSEPFIGEIKMFGGNFAPRNYAFCNGQLMAISQNTALFSLLGTNYGGDGRVTFGLPNMQARAPMHQGNGPGLTPRYLGESAGSQNVTLLQSEMPAHNHLMSASTASGAQSNPANNAFAVSGGRGRANFYTDSATLTQMGQPVTASGGNQPHNNMQPYLGVCFIIALQGIFPARN